MLVRVAFGTAAVIGVGGTAQAQVATNVSADGRTQTNTVTNGTVTTVTTATMSGGNALNSFSAFDVGNGSTVNLVVPENAHALVNIVRDRAVTIEGVVNSLQHGGIGGNVFFADPHGFVVGKSGSINVGSLTVATPTAAFLDTVLDAHGGIGSGALASLLAGDMPLSSDGTISIHGVIRAGNGVRFQGDTVTANGTITAGLAGHDALFAQAVNTDAMVEGGRLVETNGRIEIVAVGDVSLGGALSVAAGAPGSTIDIRSGNDIAVAGGTMLSASAGAIGAGGAIKLIAGRDLIVADGLSIAARGGSQQGNGGAVELSATRQETLGAASYDLGATHGATGSVLFDPASLDITANQSTNGGAFSMSADSTLHLFSGVTIDTTNGASQAGAITLIAPAITLDGTLNAGTGATAGAVSITASLTSALAGTAFGTSGAPAVSITQSAGSVITGGAVTLAASATSTAKQGIVGANATVSIAGQITGKTVTITADSASTTNNNASLAEVFADAAQAIASLTNVPFIQTGANAIGSASVPLAGIGYAEATANAGVLVLGTAHISGGTGGVLLRSVASQTIDRTDTTGVGLGIVIAKIGGASTTDIASGASVTSGGSLEVGSHDIANGTLPVTVSSGDAAGDITIAVLKSDIGASSIVHTGSIVSVAGDLSVVGRNDTNYDVETTAEAADKGKLGVAAGLSFTTASATALLGTSVGTGSIMPTNVLVEADSVGANSIVKTSASAGTKPASEVSGISSWSTFVDTLQSTLVDRYLGSLMESSDSGASPKLSSALAVNDSSATTKAEIAATDGATTAPTVKAGSTVAVVANRIDGGISDVAKSEIESKAADKNGTSYAVSAAIAVGLRNDTTLALVAPNAVITAGKVAVQANLALPKPYAWANPLLSGSYDVSGAFSKGIVSGLGQIYSDIKDLVDPSLYVTGFAESKGAGSSGSINGVVNYFGRTGATTAWVGSGAHITATDPTGNVPWQINADAGDAKLMLDATTAGTEIANGADQLVSPSADGTAVPILTFAKSVSVSAKSDTETFFLSGDRSSISTAGGGDPSSSSAAVGGVLNMYDDSSSTVAGVAANAVINAAGDLSVAANSTNETYMIDPGAGTGGGIGVTGIVVLSDLSEATHASIASSATITAPVVSVVATEGVNLWTASGAVSTGTGAGVGLSVSVNQLSTDTSAIVGDNSADAAIAHAADAVAGTSTSSAVGTISANTLQVHANTFGQAGALSVALAKAGKGSPGGLSSLVAGAKGKMKAASDAVDGVKDKLDSLLNPISAMLDASSGSASSTGGQQSASSSTTPAANSSGKASTSSGSQGFSIGIAGAASVGLYGANTTASVGHVTLNPYAAGATIATDILATRDASFFTLAGGASKVGSGDGSSGSSAGVAGALALTEDSGDTLASLVSVTAAKAGTTSVQALSNGQTVGVALGASVDTDQNSAAIAASGSLSFLHGATNADVSNSTLTGVGAVDLRVRAYNATQIALGGGAFYKGARPASARR